jgi:hypothetical protein
MNVTDRLIPGHCQPCRGCAHQGADLSHPNPCGRVRWDGPRHLTPSLVETPNGAACGDFAPAGAPDQAPATPETDMESVTLLPSEMPQADIPQHLMSVAVSTLDTR